MRSMNMPVLMATATDLNEDPQANISMSSEAASLLADRRGAQGDGVNGPGATVEGHVNDSGTETEVVKTEDVKLEVKSEGTKSGFKSEVQSEVVGDTLNKEVETDAKSSAVLEKLLNYSSVGSERDQT